MLTEDDVEVVLKDRRYWGSTLADSPSATIKHWLDERNIVYHWRREVVEHESASWEYLGVIRFCTVSDAVYFKLAWISDVHSE